MTIHEAIKQADTARANVIEYKKKYEWVVRLDAQIAVSLGLDPPERPAYADFDPAHNDELLIMPYPYDNVYPLYLMAMIDNEQQETAMFNNDSAVYNTYLVEARAWYRRTHMSDPKKNRVKGVWH